MSIKSQKSKEALLGLAICVTLLAVAALAAYRIFDWVAVGAAKIGEAERAASSYLELAAFIAFITVFDIPERIRKSRYLSSQTVLLVYLAFFLYFVFGFFSEVLNYREFARVAVLATVLIFALISVIRAVRHGLKTLSGKEIP